MILIAGDLDINIEAFDQAEEHLISTEKFHSIYGTDDIINPVKVFKSMPFIPYKLKLDILLYLLSYCDAIYMLKNWESNNDIRLLHDYACCNGYKVIYSKKF